MNHLPTAALSLLTAFALIGASAAEPPSTELFNGKDLTGWHVDIPHLDQHPDAKGAFVVRDGLLVSLGNPKGHLITDPASAEASFRSTMRC